jgi:hypothetical protein
VIHLFEADLNLIIDILFGRRAMFHQVDNNKMNPAQFAKPGGECADPSISKVLHNLTAILTHTSMGQFESDATACFDQEVMKFVLTCYHSAGAPLGPLTMWEKVLHNIVHTVKTGYELSNASYSFSAEAPIHGPGQGCRAGPSSCSTMTSVLIDGMPRLCNGIQFTDPTQQLQYEAVVSMFMDDASNGTNSFEEWLYEPPDISELVEMTRHDSQTWERFLWTSGGLLNLTKCAFYVLAWTCDAEGKASLVPKQHIPPMRLTSGNAPSSEPVRQLNFGNKMNTGMGMKDAMTALHDTAASFVSRLICSPLSKYDTWIAYFAVFVPSMAYTLPVAHHQASKLTKLQSAPTRSTLMKLGFNRNTPYRVVFGPSRYSGLVLRDLAVEQGIGQVKLLMRHLRAKSTQGTLMRITLGWWQQVVGVSYSLLEHTATPLPQLDTHWLLSIRTFLGSIGASIHISDISNSIPAPLRKRDACLMDEILAIPDTSRVHLRAFNRCCNYFGVGYLSEIATADGTSIAQDAWQGSSPRISPLL